MGIAHHLELCTYIVICETHGCHAKCTLSKPLCWSKLLLPGQICLWISTCIEGCIYSKNTCLSAQAWPWTMGLGSQVLQIYSWKQKYSTPLIFSINCYSKQVVQHWCCVYNIKTSNHPNMISLRLRAWNNYVSMGSGGWILLQILDPYVD